MKFNFQQGNHSLKKLCLIDKRRSTCSIAKTHYHEKRILHRVAIVQHPLPSGQIFTSPGCHFSYRVIGPCCRLFDREELPWPCCRLQWRGKEPSWRRIGRQFVPDLSVKKSPSYVVEILGQEASEPFVLTLYAVKLPSEMQQWWYSKIKETPAETAAEPQLSAR